MTCQSCVEKLERRLLENHPQLSRQEAHRRAVQGMMRYEFNVSLVGKWTHYYTRKGFERRKAQEMAERLIIRVQSRLARTKEAFQPMYLIEEADEGVYLVYRKHTRMELFSSLLYRWVFQTNWRASFFWSFKHHRPLWVGKGGNSPYDYTHACGSVIIGNCSVGMACTLATTCYTNTACQTCNCPAPTDPNSTLTLNDCTGNYISGCSCISKKCAGTPTCGACTGLCEYTCNPGYTWKNSVCVKSVSYAPTISSDGLNSLVFSLKNLNKLFMRKHLRRCD